MIKSKKIAEILIHSYLESCECIGYMKEAFLLLKFLSVSKPEGQNFLLQIQFF